MGSYTQIADEGRRRAAGGRKATRPFAGRGGGEHEEDAARFRCPSCDDASIVDGECPRCGERLYDSTRAVPLARTSAGTSVTGGRSLGLGVFALLVAFGIPAFFLGAFSQRAPYYAGELRALAIGAALSLAIVTITWLRARSAPRRRARRAAREARRLAESLRETALDQLPLEARERLRVRGRVRVEKVDGELALVLTSASGTRARVAVGPSVRAWEGERERLVLADGDEVEVVGRGRRVVGAGDGYRDVTGEFVFDDEEPIEVILAPRATRG